MRLKYPSMRYRGSEPYSPAISLLLRSEMPQLSPRNSLHLFWTGTLLQSDQMLIDIALLNERVQDVEDRVTTPDLATISHQEQFFVRLAFDFGSPYAERLELVNEFIDNVPKPLIGER